MSRYDLAPRADRADVASVAIGWDRPLETFFVQVQGLDPDAELLLWRGARLRDVTTARTAILIAQDFGVIPPDLEILLRIDRASTQAIADGRAQAEMKRLLFGSAADAR